MKIFLNIVLGFSLMWVSFLVLADSDVPDDAPVVAGTPSSSDDQNTLGVGVPSQNTPDPSGSGIDTSGMSLEERVALLERQMTAANHLNLMNQVNNLQQQLQELQGQVEELSHTVQTLSTQSTSQYTDVDQRLKKLEGSTNTGQPQSTQMQNQPQSGQTVIQQGQGAAGQAAYQIAYDKVKSGKYTDGIISMRKFLTQYPDSAYAPNAYYWLGQMYLLKGEGKNAAQEFDIVIHQYPQHPKVKDATLKLGFAYLLQNKAAEAKSQFKKVMQLYPGTSTAQIAEARLAQMPQ